MPFLPSPPPEQFRFLNLSLQLSYCNSYVLCWAYLAYSSMASTYTPLSLLTFTIYLPCPCVSNCVVIKKSQTNPGWSYKKVPITDVSGSTWPNNLLLVSRKPEFPFSSTTVSLTPFPPPSEDHLWQTLWVCPCFQNSNSISVTGNYIWAKPAVFHLCYATFRGTQRLSTEIRVWILL